MHAQHELLRLERNIQTWHAGQSPPAGPASLPQPLQPRPPLIHHCSPPLQPAATRSATSHLGGDELGWQRAIEAAEERAEAAERTASAMRSEAEMAEVEIVQLRRLVAAGVEERERMRAELDASTGAREVRQPAVHGLKWRGEAPPPAAAGTTAGCFEKGVGWTDFFSAVGVVERKKVSTPLPCIFGSLRVTCHRTAFAKKSQARPPYPCCSHKR